MIWQVTNKKLQKSSRRGQNKLLSLRDTNFDILVVIPQIGTYECKDIQDQLMHEIFASFCNPDEP